MKMRKYMALALAGAFLLGACGSDDKGSSAATTPPTAAAGAPASTPTSGGGGVDCKPVKPGVLSVVTSLPGPNFWGTTAAEVDPDKINSGIEFDMANDIAAKCGLKMEFRNESFDAIVAGQVDPKSYDIILSQVTITDDRAKIVDFSEGYFKADQGLLVPAGTKVASW